MFRKLTIAIGVGVAMTLAAWVFTNEGLMAQGMMGGQGESGQEMMGGQGRAGQGMMTPSTQQAEPNTAATPPTRSNPSGRQNRSGNGRRVRESNIFERPLISEMLALQGQLGLTPQQIERLQALRAAFEKESIRRSADIQAAEVDLSSLLEASQPDLAKIESQTKKISTLQAELRFARIKALEQGRAVLNQKQWEQFESLAESFAPMGPYGRRWQQGQGGPGPYGGHGMMGSGMMGGYGGYGGPGGMMGGYGGPGYGPGGGYGPGMMGGYGGGYGPGAMMGAGPVYGKRAFTSNGERIYYTGISAKTGPIPRTGGPMWVYHAGVGCVACHGVEGRGGVPVMMGTAVPEDIRYPTLTAAEPHKEGEKKEEPDHPPFTDATIKQAVTQGVDPANKPLDWTMPRWQLTDEDWADLLAYLKTLK
jgi:mono/diheme cytochrome c family protein/Spy/CpxP family protein refolding chaperone